MTEQRTVLIVEDDPMISQIVSLSLQRANYRVLLADCAAEAMEIARRCPNAIDVIVTDVLLGRERGPAVAALVREFSPNARLLLISGLPLESLYDMHLLQPQCLEDERAIFLQKPFLCTTIVQIVDNMLTAESGELDLHVAAAF
jgi:DNA-binding NtrC family response regulator